MKFLLEPWDHQKKAIALAFKALVTDNLGGFALFMEMGTGKTGTAINIIRALFGVNKRVMRTLVFCPPVVRQNWKREFKIHSKIDQKLIFPLEGAGTKRYDTFVKNAFDDAFGPITSAKKSGIFIMNYECLKQDAANVKNNTTLHKLYKMIEAWEPEVIIFDESHRLKNYKSKRTKLAIRLADKAQYKLLLTGTPILRDAMDVWSQFRILDGGSTFDKNFFAFRARYFVDKNSGMPSNKYFPDWRPIEGLADMFNRLIYRKAFRALKKDCLDLPPIVRKRIDVDMSTDQLRMYREMERNYITYLKEKACVASIALTKALRLQQIASGHFVDDAGEVHRYKSNPRLDALEEILEQVTSEHKVIVWSAFKENYETILGLCKKLGAPAVTLTGGMTDKQRQKAIDSFQEDEEIRVMVANQQAGGTGVNLTAASYMIYFTKGFGLEADLQSEARCHRGGSEVHESITRIDLVSPGTIDQVITEALARKENLATNILRLRELL